MVPFSYEYPFRRIPEIMVKAQKACTFPFGLLALVVDVRAVRGRKCPDNGALRSRRAP